MSAHVKPNTVWAMACLLLLPLFSCNPGEMVYEEQVSVINTIGKNYDDVDQLSKSTYRIDIKTIDVTMDYHPREFYADCVAEVVFTMYSNQTKPILHLDPVLADPTLLRGLVLNGQNLNLTSDWLAINGVDANQRAMEIQRNLAAGRNHTLKISYRLNTNQNYYMLNSQVSDLYGRSNEEFFPTLNRFGDMIRHTILFRVHGDIPFRCIGSGRVLPLVGAPVQSWVLDTEREVPSNTVMFVLVPQEDTVEESQVLSGVTVKIVAFRGGAAINQAFAVLSPWLAELHDTLGPFPMPSGYSVFLMGDGGGMEYFGGTISSLSALAHETFHMYFGTSLVLASYRDSWIDEAVNEWYEHSASGTVWPIAESYSSNMVSGRSPVGIGFDGRAYTEGAQILQHIAQAMGGRSAMVTFLGYLHRHYAFMPFTTQGFLNHLQHYAGLDYHARFQQWLYSGETVSAETGLGLSEELLQKHHVKISPPPEILKKYPELGQGEGR